MTVRRAARAVAAWAARAAGTRASTTLATAMLACTALAGCGAAEAGRPLDLPRSPSQLPAVARSHVMLIVLENREYGEALGEGPGEHGMPYFASLVRRGALFTDYHAIAHPSLPNYIALLAGNPLGIASDCEDCVAHGSTLAGQLEAAHRSWRAYMEGLPHPCFEGASAGGYAKKHDPFLYFPRIARSRARCRRVVPLAELARDLRARSLPAFAWITPNLCDDGHDCANASVDRFLARTVPYLLRELGAHGFLAITWDEGSTDSGCCKLAAGGRVALLLLGPDVRAGTRIGAPADHYSLLALIERSLGLPRLRGAACPCTPSLARAFTRAPR